MVRWSLSSPALRDSVIFGSEESISVVGGNVNSRTSLSSLSCFCIAWRWAMTGGGTVPFVDT